jgi:hypothetical protein
MIEQFKALRKIFNMDDGSLPDIEVCNLTKDEVISGYEIIRSSSVEIISQNPSYWSISKAKEIGLTIDDNPSNLVVDGKAEPFHICFGGIISPTGKKIPNLGLYVFQDCLAFDYRKGPEWDLEAIKGLFELLMKILKGNNNPTISHKSNIDDPEGTIFQNIWHDYWSAQHVA